MENEFCREELLIGQKGLQILNKAKIVVYGIGGVGSYVCEGLARAGVGHMVLVDFDTISVSNINRQIHAFHSTIGMLKTEAMKQRLLDINPNMTVEIHNLKQGMQEEEILNSTFSYVIDAVDTITTKIKLAVQAKEAQIPIISAMGAGNKLDPTRFEVTTIEKTSVCPLAKVMRKELKIRGIQSLKVVYSKEIPIELDKLAEEKYQQQGRKTPGSISFVPAVVGLIIASEVVKELLAKGEN